MAESKAELRLRVMAEYASSGIWVIKPIGPFRHGMIEHASLHLPASLAQEFNAWIDWYWDYLGENGVVLDIEAFNAEGLRLAIKLKAFLGSDIYVEFEPEPTANGRRQAQEIRLDK